MRSSRRHAVIMADGEVWKIYDAGSTNGTFVNNIKLTASSELHDGNIVKFEMRYLRSYADGVIAC